MRYLILGDAMTKSGKRVNFGIEARTLNPKLLKVGGVKKNSSQNKICKQNQSTDKNV